MTEARRTGNVPGCHWDHLVGADAEMLLAAGGVSRVDVVHQIQQLLNALVLTQVFATLHQVAVLQFVVAADGDALRTTN